MGARSLLSLRECAIVEETLDEGRVHRLKTPAHARKPRTCQLHQLCQGHCFGGNLGLQDNNAALASLSAGTVRHHEQQSWCAHAADSEANTVAGASAGTGTCAVTSGAQKGLGAAVGGKEHVSATYKLGGWQHACPFSLPAVLIYDSRVALSTWQREDTFFEVVIITLGEVPAPNKPGLGSDQGHLGSGHDRGCGPGPGHESLGQVAAVVGKHPHLTQRRVPKKLQACAWILSNAESPTLSAVLRMPKQKPYGLSFCDLQGPEALPDFPDRLSV
jgi:hypothetical protein